VLDRIRAFSALAVPVSDRRKVLPQYLLPKRGLTAFAGRVASRERGATTTKLVRWFVRKYGVDMSEAAEPEIAAYASFNDFFTRALREGARPLADADLICPVDGTISQFGRIEQDQILQAKGHRYSTTALVGGDHALAEQFHDGSFATLYLSPKDYHRIHMPCDGVLSRMIHVPGALFSVNPTTARGVPGCSRATSGSSACSSPTRSAGSCSPSSAPPSSAAWPRSGTARSTGRAPGACATGPTPPTRWC
jgi:phosphatidylserine decarboxylase